MPVIRQTRWYSIDECRAHPDRLYVFGDNMQQFGKGGQAVIRDEPNTIGVPTKFRPTVAAAAYFTDAAIENQPVIDAITLAFTKCRQHLHVGNDVVIPADGLGTGLAELPRRAPKVLAFINAHIDLLILTYGLLPADAPNHPDYPGRAEPDDNTATRH